MKRESIMNELYNDISSSDDEDDADKGEDHGTPSSTSASSEGSNSSRTGGKQTPPSVKGDELPNPFKKQNSSKVDALKELYGEDYEDPIGFEEAQTGEQQIKLREKIASKQT